NNKFISVITGISFFGIAIGVMAIITVLSVMNGFQNTIRDKIINTGFHIYLTSYGKTSLVYNYRKIADGIEKDKNVKVVTPFFKGQVIIKSTMQRIMGIDLHGLEKDFIKRDKSYLNTVRIIEGKFDLASPDNILVGQELAKYLDINVNDVVDIISPQGGKIKYEGRLAPIMKKYTVKGIFKTGYYEYDLKLAFTSLQSMQNLFNKPHAAWGIGIKVKDIFHADRIARKLKKKFNFKYQMFTWMDVNHNLFTALKNEKTMMSLIVFLIIIVAAFNIASTLIMMVTEKKKEIAILKTFGATPSQISNIFLLTGTFIGIVGIFFGLISGLLVSYNLEKIFHFIERVVNFFLKLYHHVGNWFTYVPLPEKFQVLATDVYYLDKLPVEVLFSDVFAICTGAIIVIILFSFFPARQAAKFKPMEIIRYE
ncbi:MAG: ABC transporter permease, partial [Spirochaetes bacterium]|nr:ABC transporter permease [Spirochaetota bacterium]